MVRRVTGGGQRSEQTDAPFVSLKGLIGAAICGADGRRFGRIHDLVVCWDLWMSHPAVSAVVVDVGKSCVRIEATEVRRLASSRPYLRRRLAPTSACAVVTDEVSLRHNVLDRQIVDARGRNTFRVSDAYLASIGPNLCVVAVDTGEPSPIRLPGPWRGSRRPTPMKVLDWAAVRSFRTVTDAKQRTKSDRTAGVLAIQLAASGEQVRALNSADLVEIVSTLPRHLEASRLFDTDRGDAGMTAAIDRVQASEASSRKPRAVRSGTEDATLSYPSPTVEPARKRA